VELRPRLPRRVAPTRQRDELFVLHVPLTPRAICVRDLCVLELRLHGVAQGLPRRDSAERLSDAGGAGCGGAILTLASTLALTLTRTTGVRLATLQLAGQVGLCAYGARPRLAQLLHEKFGHIDLLKHCGHGHVDCKELLAAHRLDDALPGKCMTQCIASRTTRCTARRVALAAAHHMVHYSIR
jgi:hypothetical protein